MDNPITQKKTLAQVMPNEFLGCEYATSVAVQYKDVLVVAEYDGRVNPWPGYHKHVMFWVTLENGKAVGWNENPAIGWSFPVIKYPQ